MSEGRDAAIIRAAGAVVWRPGSRGPEIALVHRPKYDDWSHPKGKCERDEHVLRAAVREVAEETGARVILGRPLRPSVYQTGSGTKQVSYWVARCVESAGIVPGAEVDEVAWLPATAARDRLSYQRDIALADDFLSGPARSAPFILLRHAAAGPKSAGGPGDLARPLDAHGAADAKILAPLLSCYGQCRVITSAAERCLATVRPYAVVAGMPVEVEPAFTVPPDVATHGVLTTVAAARAAGGKGPDAAGGRSRKRRAADGAGHAAAAGQDHALTGLGRPEGGVGRLLAGPAAVTAAAPEQAAQRAAVRAAELAVTGVPTVVCAHRENLQVLLEAACHALGAGPPAGPPLPKGGFWVLQSAGGVLVSAEQHDTLS